MLRCWIPFPDRQVRLLLSRFRFCFRFSDRRVITAGACKQDHAYQEYPPCVMLVQMDLPPESCHISTHNSGSYPQRLTGQRPICASSHRRPVGVVLLLPAAGKVTGNNPQVAYFCSLDNLPDRGNDREPGSYRPVAVVASVIGAASVVHESVVMVSLR